MGKTSPTSDYFGPYYRERKQAIETQRRATGQPEVSPATAAAEEYGALSAWGERKAVDERFQWQRSMEEREMEIREDEYEAKKKSGTISGIATMAGLGGTLATGLAGGAGTLVGIGTGAGTGAMLGLPAGPLGAIIGGLAGLVFGVLGKKKVICTELHRQGILSDEIYFYDSYYGNQLPDDVLIGYKLWAVPIADAMKESRLLTKIISRIAIPWAYEMAHRINPDIKGNMTGKIINKIGIPICRTLGKMVIGGCYGKLAKSCR